jgi:hypothetical protein
MDRACHSLLSCPSFVSGRLQFPRACLCLFVICHLYVHDSMAAMYQPVPSRRRGHAITSQYSSISAIYIVRHCHRSSWSLSAPLGFTRFRSATVGFVPLLTNEPRALIRQAPCLCSTICFASVDPEAAAIIPSFLDLSIIMRSIRLPVLSVCMKL